MVKVYIWNYRGKNEAWGHAAMQVDNTYMSWWPEKSIGTIYTSHPHRNRTFSEDLRAERHQPNHTIRITGLNEQAIINWWKSFGLTQNNLGPLPTVYQGPLQSWHTLKEALNKSD